MRKLKMEELTNISGGGFGGGELNANDKDMLLKLISDEKKQGNSLDDVLLAMGWLGFSDESKAFVKANW